jgi:hypothetical protein
LLAPRDNQSEGDIPKEAASEHQGRTKIEASDRQGMGENEEHTSADMGSAISERRHVSFEETSDSNVALTETKPLRSRVSVPQLDTDAIKIEVEIKTPMDTPHALTNTALERSEQLLAQLAALGLDEDNLADNIAAALETKSCALSSRATSRATSVRSTPTSRSLMTKFDTVELPVAVLDLLMEAWSKSQHDNSLDQITMPDSPGVEPEPEQCNTPDSSMPSPSSTAKDSPSLSSPLQVSPRMTLQESSRPTLGFLRSAAKTEEWTCLPGRLPSARHLQSSSTRAASPVVPSIVRHSVVAPSITLGSCGGYRSPITCTAQQTITITNTVQFHW